MGVRTSGRDVLGRTHRHRKSAANGPDGAENSHRHRHVKSRAFLAHVGRRQIDGDGLVAIAETTIRESRGEGL